MNFRRGRILVRMWLRDLRERILGIDCVSCGDHARLPKPSGWTWGTISGKSAGWMCGYCNRCQDDRFFQW